MLFAQITSLQSQLEELEIQFENTFLPELEVAMSGGDFGVGIDHAVDVVTNHPTPLIECDRIGIKRDNATFELLAGGVFIGAGLTMKLGKMVGSAALAKLGSSAVASRFGPLLRACLLIHDLADARRFNIR